MSSATSPGPACEGRVALVTGASEGGTGTAIAVRLAAAGAKVAVTARTVSGLEETRRRIEAIGGECLVLPADLSDPAGGRRGLVSRAEAELGPLDILVNDAYVPGPGAFDETTAEALETTLQVNFLGPWELMKAAVPGMRVILAQDGASLRELSVAQALDRVPAISADVSLEDLSRLVTSTQHAAFPVLDGGAIAGVLSVREVRDALLDPGLDRSATAVTFAHRVDALLPDDDLGTAVQRLAEAGRSEAVVVDSEGRPLGVVTREGILEAWRRATLPG